MQFVTQCLVDICQVNSDLTCYVQIIISGINNYGVFVLYILRGSYMHVSDRCYIAWRLCSGHNASTSEAHLCTVDLHHKSSLY